jgi:hypothetical protein
MIRNSKINHRFLVKNTNLSKTTFFRLGGYEIGFSNLSQSENSNSMNFARNLVLTNHRDFLLKLLHVFQNSIHFSS